MPPVLRLVPRPVYPAAGLVHIHEQRVPEAQVDMVRHPPCLQTVQHREAQVTESLGKAQGPHGAHPDRVVLRGHRPHADHLHADSPCSEIVGKIPAVPLRASVCRVVLFYGNAHVHLIVLSSGTGIVPGREGLPAGMVTHGPTARRLNGPPGFTTAPRQRRTRGPPPRCARPRSRSAMDTWAGSESCPPPPRCDPGSPTPSHLETHSAGGGVWGNG